MAEITSTPFPDRITSASDDGYPVFERLIAERIARAKGPLFVTDASGLFDRYLAGLREDRRQHYDCRTCQRFIERYGALVEIDEAGEIRTLLWEPDGVPDFFRGSVKALRKAVLSSKVSGVFLLSEASWGVAQTQEWTHLSGHNSNPFVATALKSAGQAMAEKREEYGMLCRGLADFPKDVVAQAVRVLKTEAIDRPEKTLGIAEWLRDLQGRVTGMPSRLKENVIWLAVANAPPGWCHVRTTMIATLLEDLTAGMSFDVVKARWAAKMHPLQYQRPSAAPKAGAIERAEKVVAELGLASELRRRFARLDEVVAYWTPRANEEKPKTDGVFGHLKAKTKEALEVVLPTQTMTWRKFRETVLPDAMSVEFRTNGSSSFFGMVTAADAEAKPILQWDDEPRNPVSWYFWVNGSPPRQWGLPDNAWVKVNAVCESPPHWHHPERGTHHSAMAMLILEGCRESQANGAGLFPECVRSDLHEIRSVIEAHSRSTEIEGRETGTANGVAVQKSGMSSGYLLRIRTREGFTTYRIDRWD